AGPALAEPLAALGFAAAPAGSYRFAGRVRGRPEHRLALQLSEGRIGATRVTADGALGTRPRFDDANLAVALRGPSLAAAAAGLTDVALPDLPFAVEARLLGDLRAPSVGNLAASVGQTRLDTHGRTGWPPGFADTDLRFLLQIADPAELAPALADSAWRGRPLRVRGVLRRSGNGFALRDGALESEGLHADFSAGLPAGPGLAGLSVELTAAGPDLGLLLPGSTHDRLAELPFRAEAVVHAGAPEPDVTLSADGGVWQALAAGLHGRALLRGGPGRVWNPGMQRAPGSFPSRLIAKLIPFAPEPYTLVECGAVAVGAADGVVRLDPGLVLRTPEVDVTLTGSIDLNSESIDLQASNAVRQGIDPSAAGLVERLVEVGGTLGEPRIVLDAPKALASGSAAGTVGRPTPVARELLDRVAAAAANPCTAVGESVETDGIEPLGETSPPGAAL
ncbi:MAG: AsmA-like C-terminal region-containing protein, partial [Gammaproteobacteria bacterium]